MSMGAIKNISELPSKFDKFYDIFDISKIGLWEMTPQGDVTFYNKAFYDAFDLPLENPTLDDWINVVDDAFKNKFNTALHQQTARQQRSFKSEYKVKDKYGKSKWIEAIGIADYDDSGNMLSMIGSHSDITFLRVYGDKLYDLTYIEPVTGLYNRHKLNEVIQNDLDNHQAATLIFMNFYLIRHLFSLYGYDKANFIVQENVASVLKTIDLDFQPFRVSTSKFALLIRREIDRDEIHQTIEHIKHCIAQVRSTQKVDIAVDFHSAVLSYPLDQDINTSDEIINRAYLTLEESKFTSESNIKFYCSQTQTQVYKHIFIESSISLAIKRGELFNVYHPIIDAQTNELKGFEALVRWNTAEWGPIFPDEFIATSEQNGSICELGLSVFEDACNFIKRYNALNGTQATISVNASALEMIRCDYISKIQSVLDKTKVAPELITIEITESMMIDRSSTLILESLQALRKMGFDLSLDDFGSGYASLNSMIYAPLTEVKIDREIMRTVMSKPLIKGFIQSVIHLCQEHNVSVVAEGIEDEDMLSTARQMKADKIQGYYYAKPLSHDEALKYTLPKVAK